MATRMLGIDIGHFSVKLALVEAGFRSARLVELYQKELSLDENMFSSKKLLAEHQLETLRRLLKEHHVRFDQSALALAESSRFALLSFPFSDRKKIEQLLPFELEGELLTSPEEEWIDFGILPPLENSSPSITSIFAALARKEETQTLLQSLKELRLDPRVVSPAALSTSAIAFDPSLPAERPLLVIDLGHRFTHVCGFYHPQHPGFARTIDRGGHQITLALSQAQNISYAAAQALKHQTHLLPRAKVEKGTALTESMIRNAQIMKEAWHPLIRELRQTIAASLARYGVAPTSLLLVGGGSNQQGIVSFLEQELGIKTKLWEPERHPALQYFASKQTNTNAFLRQGASATLLALGTGSRIPLLNFRKAERSQQTNFLRQKIPALLVSGVGILLCASLSLGASYYQLKKENKLLDSKFQTEAKLLFGKKTELSAEQVITEIEKVTKKTPENPIPALSTYDLMKEISANTPSKSSKNQDANVDLQTLEISAQKVAFRGHASSVEFIQEWVDSLNKAPCLKEIKRTDSRPDDITLGGQKVNRIYFTIKGENDCFQKK